MEERIYKARGIIKFRIDNIHQILKNQFCFVTQM